MQLAIETFHIYEGLTETGITGQCTKLYLLGDHTSVDNLLSNYSVWWWIYRLYQHVLVGIYPSFSTTYLLSDTYRWCSPICWRSLPWVFALRGRRTLPLTRVFPSLTLGCRYKSWYIGLQVIITYGPPYSLIERYGFQVKGGWETVLFRIRCFSLLGYCYLCNI